jgi:Phage integrase, N-terminal SAM-like domain
MVQDFAEAHLIKRLVDRIETAMHPLHWSGGWPHCCKRIEMGTGFSKPEDHVRPRSAVERIQGLHRTREVVSTKLRRAQQAQADNLPMPFERLTLADFLTDWLIEKQKQLRPESYRRYDDLCRLYIIPILGKVRLVRLDVEHIQRLRTTLEGRVSSTTAQHVHSTLSTALSTALQDAVRWGA